MAAELSANRFVDRLAALVPPTSRPTFVRSARARGRTRTNRNADFRIRMGSIFELAKGAGRTSDLEIVEATDPLTVREAATLIDESFEAQSRPDDVMTLDCLDDGFRLWVGRIDGRAVTTAAAYIADGYV